MPLPAKFLERHLPLVEEAQFMGIPFKDLTREELMAVAIAGWSAQMEAQKELTAFKISSIGMINGTVTGRRNG